jgi:hypothetical protein
MSARNSSDSTACLLFARHALSLLGDIGPVQLGVIDQFAGSAAAQQAGLLLGPDQDVLFVQIAHAICSLRQR